MARDIFETGMNRGNPGYFWSELESVPQEWLQPRLEEWIKQLLKPDDDFAYMQLLPWLNYVHEELASTLVKQALQSRYRGVVEVAKEYLQDLEEQKKDEENQTGF